MINNYAESILKRYELRTYVRDKAGKFAPVSGGGISRVSSDQAIPLGATESFVGEVNNGITSIPQSIRDKVKPQVVAVDRLDGRNTEEVLGTYNFDDETIRVPESVLKEGGRGWKINRKAEGVTRHEYGHAVDHHFEKTKGALLSSRLEFVQSWRRSRRAVEEEWGEDIFDEVSYILGSPKEFVAEAFNVIISGSTFWGEELMDAFSNEFSEAFSIVEKAVKEEFDL